MAYLLHYAIADPCVHHFEVDGDPHQALAAPVTEIVILRSKSGDWGWDQELCSGIKGATRGVNMVEGSYPPLRWGEVRDVGDSGSYCMFVGWDSVQVNIICNYYRNSLSHDPCRHISVQSVKNRCNNTLKKLDKRHLSSMPSM